MCKRSMEQYTHPAADERDAAAADGAAPEQQEEYCAGTSSCGTDATAGSSLAEKQTKGGRAAGEESARERLKRHRTEMAGRVRIPDMWGQERLLKDWVDCAVFDRPLAATRGLLTARDALVAERAAQRRTTTARPLRVHDGCS
ncbi:protein BIC2 [Brachypodium distachyon]|uniref:Uncharacterized protein n=1 Tax=Brachypodium distachyon TaxID=15368 RepID=I1IA76_BRADI|nr:protein BIC2 [Brachypodium distachyon]KQJ99726.1 hypothetical protein BRADI_3g44900v3 [Brachypodium distachyon]|eukprot:XP_003575071.1 protein BIC2 [Brachypodium distachyon]